MGKMAYRHSGVPNVSAYLCRQHMNIPKMSLSHFTDMNVQRNVCHLLMHANTFKYERAGRQTKKQTDVIPMCRPIYAGNR